MFMGMFQPVGETIKIEKLVHPRKMKRSTGLLAVWTAGHWKSGGTVVVGWYKDATALSIVASIY